MPILRVYVSDADLEQLERHAGDLGRTVEDLAESAVSEAVCRALQTPHDPRQGKLGL